MKSRLWFVFIVVVIFAPEISQARWLKVDTGRFMTMDTFEGNQENPQSLHKYPYAGDNPVNNTDRSGNDFVGDVMTIGDMLGGLDGMVNVAQLAYNRAMSVAYRQRAFDLLYNVIRPTLNDIDHQYMQYQGATRLAGKNAEWMLLGTAIAESGDLNTRRQHVGPALGLFQMEPATHDSLWNNYLSHKPALSEVITNYYNLPPPPPPPNVQLLVTDDSYATIMARVRYLPGPALPSYDDLKGQAQYWVQYYNRGGRGTVADYLARWHRVMGYRQ